MLSLNARGQFILQARTPELVARAEAAALTYSIPTSASQGCAVYFSDIPYQVLEFVTEATPQALARLEPLLASFRQSSALDASNRYVTPAGLDLMPFQRAGVRYALEQPHVLIGDAMGLGKTVQAIAVANEMQCDRVLAIVPGGARRQWAKIVREWTMTARPFIHTVFAAKAGLGDDLRGRHAHWTIISYNLLSNKVLLERLIKELRPQLLILDEAHFLKEISSNRSRAVWGYHDDRADAAGLAEGPEKILALTGTPLPNRPAEGYNLCRGLNWGAVDFMSQDAYRNSFNPSVASQFLDKNTGEWKYRVLEKAGRLRELQARMRCNFMVRRLQPQVLTQLPRERYEITFLEPDGAIRKQLKAEEPLLLKVKDFEDLEGLSIAEKAHIATLRREMGIAKTPRVVEYVNQIMQSSSKLVVFAYHREVLAMLREKLESHNPVLYWGGMSATAQERAKQHFIHNRKVKLFLGQINASGVALDGLQHACSHALFAEFDWVPGNNAQALHRLQRIGQRYSTLAEFVIAPGGLCERILGSSLDKLRTTSEALD